MTIPYTYKRLGDKAIIIELPNEINEEYLSLLVYLKETISHERDDIQDIVIGYNSMTILYADDIENMEIEYQYFDTVISKTPEQIDLNSKTWEIPVCYDIKLGIDLEELSGLKQLSVEQIIEKHSSPLYTVYFVGFLPGFLYLGGLEEVLHTSRKSTPRLRVAKGSVGIGGSQTGIYPQDTAGGWNIIGRTPISFFDVNATPPCFAKSGDKVKFKPITLEEYHNYPIDYPKILEDA